MDDLIRLLRTPQPLLHYEVFEDVSTHHFRARDEAKNYRIDLGTSGLNELLDENSFIQYSELQINISSLQFPKRVRKILFWFLRGNDIKNCRLVCKEWNIQASLFLDEKTTIVFNGENSPWVFFTPAITYDCMEYLRTSLRKFSYWSSMKIYCGTTSQLEPLLSEDFGDIFYHSVKGIKSLHLQTCSLDWDTLCKLWSHFSNLESLFDDQNLYLEQKSMLFKVVSAVSSIPLSPLASCTNFSQVSQVDFVHKFRKYNSALRLKTLKIQDSGIDTHTSCLIQLLCKIIVDGFLEELTIIPGGFAPSLEENGELTTSDNFKKDTNIEFWMAVGEMLAFSKKSLKRLTVSCIHETSPVNSFDLFMKGIQIFNKSDIKGNDIIVPLEYLFLDFKFLWLNHQAVESELVPFVQSLHQLKKFCMKTIIIGSSTWIHRLEMLKPSMAVCYFDIEVHVTDVEGESKMAATIDLMRSKLYKKFMTKLHVSILTRDVLELGQMISTDPDIEYTNVKKFRLTVMNTNFLDFRIDVIASNYPNLTVLELIDGLLIRGIDGSVNQNKIDAIGFEVSKYEYGNLPHAVFDDVALQVIIRDLTKLQVLSLQCNMGGLSDVGITGMSKATCSHLKRSGDTHIKFTKEQNELLGHSRPLGDLKELRKLTLLGLGKLLTDISVHYGFLKMTNLRHLALYGNLDLSANAKMLLNKHLLEERCNIKIHL